MTQQFSNPSLNPADNDSLVGVLSHTFRKMLEKTAGMMPAKVLAYDSNSNSAQVQIMIPVVNTSGVSQDRAPIAKVPVFTMGAGNFLMRFPVNSGSLGWIIANDRDISNFLKYKKSGAPNTRRVKNFSDGVFFPHYLQDYVFDPGNSDKFVLQNASGTVTITLSDSDITLTAPTIKLNGRVIVEQDLNCGGNITAAGTISPNTPIPP